MLQKLSRITALLPVIAIAVASITFVKGLFYDFHNDTVPLFSIVFSCMFSAIGVGLVIVSGIAVVCFWKAKQKRLQLLLTGVILACTLAFSGLCLLCYGGATGTIVLFCTITALLSVLTAVLCMLIPDKTDPET